MDLTVESESGARLDGALEELLRVDPFLAYSNFAPIAGRPGALARVHAERWRLAGHADGVFVVRDSSGRPLAALRTQPREFESGHFGIPMSSLETPLGVAEEDRRLTALRAGYRVAIERLRERGFRHVAAQASTQDRSSCWALQEQGCFHVGTRISWMAPLTGVPDPVSLPPGLRIEVLDRTSIGTLPARSWRRLHEWCGTAFDRGPLVFDLGVDRDLATAVYQVWTRKALTGEWADALLVVRDGDEVVAFNSMMLLPDLSEGAGVGILGRGIGASLPGYRGLFTALQRTCAAQRPLGAAHLENETQSSTVASIHVFGKLGHPCLRSTASFHRRLDEHHGPVAGR